MQLLNELEELSEYLAGEDSFFYTMVYDPNQKTLMVDKGEIRIGSDYQADVPPLSASGSIALCVQCGMCMLCLCLPYMCTSSVHVVLC